MALIFDPASKRIVLDRASISATEVYSRSLDWLALSDNAKYGSIFRVAGGDDLGSGLSIPPYFFLQGAWRVRPMELDHDLDFQGNLFVEGGGNPFVRTLGPFQVNVRSTVPVQAQGISTSGGSGVSAVDIWSYSDRTLTSAGAGGGATLAEIEASNVLAKQTGIVGIDQKIDLVPAAVRTNLTTELARIDAPISGIQAGTGGLTPSQETMLLELYALFGLDPTKPLVVTENSRTAGSIHQNIISSTTETLVTRGV